MLFCIEFVVDIFSVDIVNKKVALCGKITS